MKPEIGKVFSNQFGGSKSSLDISMFILGALITAVFFLPTMLASALSNRFALAVFLANFACCVLLGSERFVLVSIAWLAILTWSLLPFLLSRKEKKNSAHLSE
jgi:ascorbate-specific PTS system EIIC-type component UlaA